MGWLNKIFKGSNHKLYEGHNNDSYVDNGVVSNTASTSEEPDVQDDDEDIDRAIALSLLEEDNRRTPVFDHGSQVKEDEELARALQESLKVESPPQTPQAPQAPHYEYGNGSLVQPISVPYPTGYRICAGCRSEIGFGRFLSCMGGLWHPECFRCHGCNSPISGYEFSMYGGYPYHKACYKEQYHPKCGVCRQFIPTNPAGLIEYRAHPFWDQKYCPSHELDGTPRCCSCERMEPQDTGYVPLADGRKLCLECLDSAVMDTNECQPLYLDIQEFYECLNMKVEQHVPLLLVERQALNEAMEGEKQGHHHMPETRGLCLSEEQTISTVLRRPRVGPGTRTMDMVTEPYRLTRRCDVTAILVLYGLPRLLTGSILAHEMMHAWLRLKGFRMLNPQIEEGICQVLAYMWLESQLGPNSVPRNQSVLPAGLAARSSSSSTRSPFEMKLGQFFRNQIESDISPVYGDGFRAAHQTVLKYGLPRTLDHIQMTGSLPF
ncbi:protein DA1-like [Silene latifolia]|uniref:protein DA1-like n=1 Tax=Silene latifolia TaxID=37657 RepID=UPI003D777949